MFMIQENKAQEEELKKIYKKVKAIYGIVPPQMKLLGNIEASYVEDFLKMALRVGRHEHIDIDVFTFIRLHIAYKESYIYCKQYNTNVLLSRDYTQAQLDAVIKNIENIPFGLKEKELAKYAVKSIYNSSTFNQEDFDKLNTIGWSQKDVFDAIEHAATLLKNGRILNTYLKKN